MTQLCRVLTVCKRFAVIGCGFFPFEFCFYFVKAEIFAFFNNTANPKKKTDSNSTTTTTLQQNNLLPQLSQLFIELWFFSLRFRDRSKNQNF